MKAVALLVGAALSAGVRGGGATAADGFVSERDACSGASDLWQQGDLFRPWGGVLAVPPGLSPEARGAIGEAVRLRYKTSGAVWRVVPADGPLPVGLDGLLVASCGPEMPGLSWVHKKPTGALAVRWGAAPPSAWAAGIAQSLALAEGDGPL